MDAKTIDVAPFHDFLACIDCKKADANTVGAVRKIWPWAEALIEVAPVAIAYQGEPDPEDHLRYSAAAVEGLACAIAYEAERLEGGLPARALCDEGRRLRKAVSR